MRRRAAISAPTVSADPHRGPHANPQAPPRRGVGHERVPSSGAGRSPRRGRAGHGDSIGQLQVVEIAALKVDDLYQNRGLDSLRVSRKGGKGDALAGAVATCPTGNGDTYSAGSPGRAKYPNQQEGPTVRIHFPPAGSLVRT
jgi:hypothetical protein